MVHEKISITLDETLLSRTREYSTCTHRPLSMVVEIALEKFLDGDYLNGKQKQ